MEAVRIMCQLSERQISQLVDFVSAKLPTHPDDLNDIDELMLMNSVRVCIDFDIDSMQNIKILSAEILNRDWEVLDTDSFAFNQYLTPIIDDYNKRKEETRKQHKQIRTQRRTFQPY